MKKQGRRAGSRQQAVVKSASILQTTQVGSTGLNRSAKSSKRILERDVKMSDFHLWRARGEKHISSAAYSIFPLQLCHSKGKLPPLESTWQRSCMQ